MSETEWQPARTIPHDQFVWLRHNGGEPFLAVNPIGPFMNTEWAPVATHEEVAELARERDEARHAFIMTHSDQTDPNDVVGVLVTERDAANARAEAAEARERNRMCSVCAGEGDPGTGRPCVCGGEGTEDAEMRGLRGEAFALHEIISTERQAREKAEGERDGLRALALRLKASVRASGREAEVAHADAVGLAPDPEEWCGGCEHWHPAAHGMCRRTDYPMDADDPGCAFFSALDAEAAQ